VKKLLIIVFSQDKYKRSLADSDNMRKRLTKQIEDAKTFGIQSFCKDLLAVADALGHAIESVPREAVGLILSHTFLISI
jgi:molecular chaperone GrpE